MKFVRSPYFVLFSFCLVIPDSLTLVFFPTYYPLLQPSSSSKGLGREFVGLSMKTASLLSSSSSHLIYLVLEQCSIHHVEGKLS